MALSLAPQLTQITYRWSELHGVWLTKALVLQFVDDGDTYTAWGYDGPEVHVCTIWKGAVPSQVIEGGYTQEQNDADKADFESHKSALNKTIDPRAADGKPFMLPSIFPYEMILNFAGKPDANGQRYGGDLFGLERSGAGIVTRDFGYQDGVFITGGNVSWRNGGFGSYISLDMFAPSSTVTDPTVPNTGNCNLAPTGLGFDMIIPANGNGAKNLGIITPVPAERDEDQSPNGYWEYTDPWLGKGEVSAGVPGASKFNLFNTQLHLCHFCDIHAVLDQGIREAVLQSIKPKWILPQWILRVTIYNAHSDKTLQAGWDLVLARKRSV